MACGDERGTDPRPRFWVLFAVRPDMWASTSAFGPHRGRGLGRRLFVSVQIITSLFPFFLFCWFNTFLRGWELKIFSKAFMNLERSSR